MAETITATNKTPLSQGSIKLEEGITEADEALFNQIIATELTPEQRQRLRTPAKVFPRQEQVLAVHWHPEFIPMDLAAERISAMFPNSGKQLIIPTQHNEKRWPLRGKRESGRELY